MKKILFFFWFLVSLFPAYAQKRCDALYLVNGSVIRGTITVRNDTMVRIVTCCGSEWVYPLRDIRLVTREKNLAYRSALPRRGYINFTSFGVMPGASSNQKKSPFSVIMEHNYRISRRISAGSFVGFEQWVENVLPLGADLKLYVPAGRTDIFLSGAWGYSVSLFKPDEPDMKKALGGPVSGVETGVMIPLTAGSAITLSVGYRYTRLHYNMNNYWYGDYRQNITFNRLMIRFGLSVF